jgi:hypothetical protein
MGATTGARVNNLIVVGADDSVGPKLVANDSGPTGFLRQAQDRLRDPTGARQSFCDKLRESSFEQKDNPAIAPIAG